MTTMLASHPHTHFSSPDDRTATEPAELRWPWPGRRTPYGRHTSGHRAYHLFPPR